MSYSLLSHHYDELVGFDYSGYFYNIKDKIPDGGMALDLAAGTARFSVLLADRFKVTALDSCPEMLSEGAKFARANRKNILFLEGDINNLSITKKYDLITSTCDGFNYVESDKNLEALFEEIYNALNEGGKLVFDVSTEYKAENVLKDNVFYEDNEAYTLLWTNTGNKHKLLTEITQFTLKGDVYEREDESFYQYFYSAELIKSLLAKVGFTAEFLSGNFKKFTDTSDRLVVIASK